MINFILALVLLFPHSAFETVGDEKATWKDWTEIRKPTTVLEINGSDTCQIIDEFVVCPQIVAEANAGPGRAYAIACGYIYDSPDMDICLEQWQAYQIWVPFFNTQIQKWFIAYPHIIIRILVELPLDKLILSDDFVLWGLRIDVLDFGYIYSWWERDSCLEEQ